MTQITDRIAQKHLTDEQRAGWSCVECGDGPGPAKGDPMARPTIQDRLIPLRDELTTWIDENPDENRAGKIAGLVAGALDLYDDNILALAADIPGSYWPDTARAEVVSVISRAAETYLFTKLSVTRLRIENRQLLRVQMGPGPAEEGTSDQDKDL